TLYAKALKKNIEENADYRRIKENIEEYQAKAGNDLEAVSKTCEHAINAWYFLKNQNVKMPNYKLRIELVKGAKAYATTVTPMFVGNPYVCVYMGQIAGGTQKEYDMLLVTLCHEMLHVVQREYVSKKRANFTFDEMTAADIEEKACDYFIEKGIIETPKEILLEVTLGQVGWFALPLDATTETYPEGSISNYSFSKTKEAEAAYPRSAFITYIREVSPPAEEEYSSVLNLYRMKWFAGVTSLIKNNFFHINTEEELTQAWHAFSQYYQTKFYEEAHKGLYDKSSDYMVFAPNAEIGENKDKQQVVLNNKDYTIRVRRIRANQPANQDYAKEYALVLKYNDDYRKNMETNGDFKITPLGTSEKVKYEEWENGLYFEPTEYSEKTEKVGGKEDSVLYNYDYYLMEADGGTEEKGFFGNPSDSGYALYALRNPEKPVTSVKDGILTVQLKDIRSEDRAEVVDSYVVTILCNGEDVFHRQVMLGDVTTYSYINANELERNGSQLSEEDKANLQLIIQECVTGTYSDGKGMYGPKSEPVAIDLSTKEKQTGTGDGYWQQTAVYQQMGSRTESGTYRREDITNQTTTYTVSSGHYEYETTYNINGETANHQFVDVTIPPEKIEPGDEIEFRSTGGDLTLDIDIVWDAEIENGNDYSGTYFRQGTTTNEEHLYRTPSEKGKTGKMVICYRDSLSKMITVFLYDWTEE
ncbi:MAG: hypothetical protein IKO32_12925, partial [Lachnospiraceae bacterium]|nr:hypothetical protein [Lachnospiraceae bacterium]